MVKNKRISTGTLAVSEPLVRYLDSLDLDYKTVIAGSDISTVPGRKDVLSLATFYNIIGGQVSRITNKNARKLAKGIGTPVEDLYLISLGKMGGKASSTGSRELRLAPVFDSRELALQEPRNLTAELDMEGKKRRTVVIEEDGTDKLPIFIRSVGLPFLAKGCKGLVALVDPAAPIKDDDWVVAKLRRDKGCEIQLQRYRKPSHHRGTVFFGPDGSEEVAFEDLHWCYRVTEMRFVF